MFDRYLTNVSTLKLDVDRCVGCRMCEKVCPQHVWEIRDKKAVIAANVNFPRNSAMGAAPL